MSSLNRGLASVTEATTLDKEEKFAKAIVKYDEALQFFAKATREESNEKTVAIIKQKMLEYKARSDELRKLVASSPSRSTATTTTTKTTTSKAPSNNDDENDSRDDGPVEFRHPPAIDWSALQEQEGKVVVKSVAAPAAATAVAAPKRNSSLDKGIALMEQATALDEQRRFEDALKAYEAGLEQFLDALKNAQPPLQTVIKAQMSTYMTRAEQLKKWLNSKRTNVNEAAAPHLSAAIDVVQRAIDADNAGQTAVAMSLYETAIEHFRAALKVETNNNARSMITDKMINYAQRVETLRQAQRNGGSVVANPIKFGLEKGEKYKDPLKKNHFWQ